MAKSSGKWYNNTWLQVVVGSLICPPIASAFYDKTKNIPVLAPVTQFLNFIWIDIFNFKISLYIAFIILIVTIIGVRNYWKFQNGLSDIYSSLPPEAPKVDFLNWTKGSFKNWTWTWKWILNTKFNTYVVSNLIPICDKCGYKMKGDPGYAIYKCPNCDNIYAKNYESSSDIASIIEQKLENGDYPKN